MSHTCRIRVTILLCLAVVLAAGGAITPAHAGSRPGTAGIFFYPPPGTWTDASVAWGLNDEGQLGTGDTVTPTTRIVEPRNVFAAAAGRGHTLVVAGDGTVWGWGSNNHGQLGNGTTRDSTEPVQVLISTNPAQPLRNVEAIAAGGDHSLAITMDGTVWAWGDNTYGQLGDGTTISRSVATPVPGLKNAWEVEAGPDYSLASTSVSSTAGVLWAWGHNNQGQLGDGTHIDHSLPAPVADPQAANRPFVVETNLSQGNAAVAAGDAHALAIQPDGTVWAWGDNASGELGIGTFTSSDMPVQVQGLQGITTVAAGGGFSVASGLRGQTWAWGANAVGELGNGNTSQSSVPVPVNGLPATFSMQLAAGHDFVLARTGSGAVFAWGGNAHGQLGVSGPASSSNPVQVPGIAGAQYIAAGYGHSLAIVQFQPVTTAAISPAPNSSGWNNGPVTVTLHATANPLEPPVTATYYAVDDFTCGSNHVSSCTAYTGPFTISAPGKHTVYFFSIDQEGNTDGQFLQPVNIDTAPPAISLTIPVDGSIYPLHAIETAAFTCSDPDSGIASCTRTAPSGPPVDTSSVGTYTFTVNATDKAGNSATATAAYTVDFAICHDGYALKPEGPDDRLTLRLQLCDAAGHDVSSHDLLPRVLTIKGHGKRIVPHQRFAFKGDLEARGPGYALTITLPALPPGYYEALILAGADPTTHTITFRVR